MTNVNELFHEDPVAAERAKRWSRIAGLYRHIRLASTTQERESLQQELRALEEKNLD